MNAEIIERPRNTQIKRYSPIEAGLEELRQRHYGVVVDVTTPSGMRLAKDGRAELKKVRLALEEARKDEKEESLKYGRLVDAEAKRIREIIEPMEENYDRAIKAEEKRVEDEKQAKANAARIAEEQRLQAIRDEEAKALAAEKLALEAERARLADVERKLQEQQAAAQAEHRAAQEASEVIQREARLKVELEERRAREIKEESDRKLRAAQVEAEEVARKARVKAEEEALALKRHNDRLLGAREMLKAFVQSYGQLEQFKDISAAISKFLGEVA